ncbi:lactonase family protein [Pedobacter sp. JY14-1]|uniref:lactonase family protein n=1 Tax=Pedobacter sp. JY14-1 TaxID=3034151 RepID=UPI0023E102A0|nr:lactonase family protein [Pedobacter sp. JY14-1]
MYQRMLIGSYTDEANRSGLQLCTANSVTRTLEVLDLLEISNASYFCFNADESIVYAVNENHTPNDSITAVQIDNETNKLRILDTVKCGGSDPCYISTDINSKNVFIANYSGGSLCVAGLTVDGLFTGMSQVIWSEGTGSHMHAAILCPKQQYLLVTDLGSDTLSVYCYNSQETRPLNTPPFYVYKFNSGTGPRHLAFSPDQRYLVVLGELNGTLTVLKWDSGSLRYCQCVSLVHEDFQGDVSAADLHFSNDGRFLYASNRGDANEIVVFSFDTNTGSLHFVERYYTHGAGPRNFVIDPTGRYLWVANQYSGNLRLFDIDCHTGLLKDSEMDFKVSHQPVCLKFFR